MGDISMLEACMYTDMLRNDAGAHGLCSASQRCAMVRALLRLS